MAKVLNQLIEGVSQLTAERDPSAGKAVRIVDFQSNKRAAVNVKEMQRIIKQEDIPTVIVSIGGVARSGKSFLLNLLVNYLTYLEKHNTDSGWATSDLPVQGVSWAKSKKAVTLGIWIWSKAFVIRRLDGKTVAVLLVDSQGTGDNAMSDASLDALVMYISLQLSSFQLVNIVNYLTANDLTSLQLCTDYADINEGSSTRDQSTCCHLFDNLIFVIRNCQDCDQFGEDSKRFEMIKADCVNPDLRRTVEGIEKAFKRLTTFAFPYPSTAIARASEDQKKWTLQDIPKEFLDPVQELATVMFTSDRIAVEELPTGSQILEKFMVLKMRLESKDLPEIGNPADALQETILYQAFSKANTLYTGNLTEVQKSYLSHKSEVDLRETLASARDLALQVFYSEGHQHKYGASIIWSKYEELFQKNCDEHQSVLIMKYNQDKKIADMVQHSQEVERRMEQQAQEAAARIEKLESDNEAEKINLEESKKASEKRDQDHRAHLDEVKKQMETAHAKDLAALRTEIERTENCRKQEEQKRRDEEEKFKKKERELNEVVSKVNIDLEQKKRKAAEEQQRIEANLERERNRPKPKPAKKWYECLVM